MATKKATGAPTWATETVRVALKGSGMKPLKATQLHLVTPDGAVLSNPQMEALAVWPSARLRIIFGESVNWFGQSKGRWHDQAVALAMSVAPLASPKWIVQDIIGRNDIAVLAPLAYRADEAKKLASRALFDHTKDDAWVCLRSGGPKDATWDACVLVTQRSVQVHLPPTAANVALLEKELDRIVGEAPFAWGGVGYGWDGLPTVRALVRNTTKPKASYAGVALRKLEQVAPTDGVDALLWLGRAWCKEEGLPEDAHEKLLAGVLAKPGRTVTRTDGLVRVAVARPKSPDDAKGAKAGEKLGAELAKVVANARALSRRAILRKRR